MPAPTPRTTPELVGGIVEIQSGIDVSPYILAANSLVTNVCTPGITTGGYTDGFAGSTMELIERWLSAHFYCQFDQQLSAAKAGTVAVRYQHRVGLMLQNTEYGQAAMALDYLGLLAAASNTAQKKRRITVKIEWIGTRRRRFLIDGAPDVTVCL